MELDTLKEIWRQQLPAEPMIKRHDILRVAMSRSKTPVAMMKRNLLFELITVIILYGFAILYFATATSFSWVAALLGVLGILYGVYYTRKKQLLDQVSAYDHSIRHNLEIHVTLLSRYMKWYGWVTALLTPAIFLIMLVVWKGETNLTAWYWPGNQEFYLLFAALAIGFSVISFVVNKWYVYQLYGKHLQELKKVLEELEERRQTTEDGRQR